MSLDPTIPFTRAEGLAAGLSVTDLAGPRFRRLFHGLYVAAGPIDVRTRALAALKICPPGSFASHQTAAALWGGIVAETPDTHITVPAEAPRTKRQGIVAHSAQDVGSRRHRGLLVSAPTRAFLEVTAGRANLVELVVLGDSLVGAERCTPGDLVVAAASYDGRGARLARRAAALVRPGVDSPTETRLRLLIVLAGLPEPSVNHILRRTDGSWRRRFELSFPELMLIVEYDGRHHIEVRDQWARDLRRREELERDGWRLVVIIAEDLQRDPDGTLERIRRAMADRGLRIPPRPSAEWYRLFGGRRPSGSARAA